MIFEGKLEAIWLENETFLRKYLIFLSDSI